MKNACMLSVCIASSLPAWAAETTVPPRAARSVHLGYQAPDAMLFYNEMTVLESTPGSYFMAAGWNTGYFGIQELSDGRKVILFSVWDPTQGDDPNAVKQEERVECVYNSPDVRVRRFGGEGTGGQCMGSLDWKIGDPLRFVVTATADGNKTVYAGYVRLNDRSQWKHLVTFRTRSGGQSLRGLYAFIEDFRRDGRSVFDIRRARFGNGWVKTPDGNWSPLNHARFTASGAEWEDKDRINAGLENGRFFLATGGDTKTTVALRSTLELPPGDRPWPEVPSRPRSVSILSPDSPLRGSSVFPIPQSVIDHFGVAVAAVTGVLAARGKQVDLFGVIVLAIVTAFGGGTIRDLTLGDVPVFWAKEPWFVINAALTAVITFCLLRYRDLPTAALLVADAVVLACFTMAGARRRSCSKSRRRPRS